MTNEQYKLVKPILDTFETKELKELCIAILNDFPEYIWHIPASSSGKYHPVSDLGEGGLMRHQIKVAKICNWRLGLKHYQKFCNEKERDCMRIACLCHDGRKSGETDSGHTLHEHPLLMGKAVLEMKNTFPNLEEEIEDIANLILRHMGEWTTSKYSDVVLFEPVFDREMFVHECDFLASRKEVEIDWR